MHKKRIPKGPWSNGVVQEGQYDAIVHGVEYGAYRRGDGYYRIVLWLVKPQTFLVTNIYVRDDLAGTANTRIWHFCQACNETAQDFGSRLSEFCAKHIRVTLVTISVSRSGASAPYSDVDRFLRPTHPLNATAWDTYREATGQSNRSISEQEKKEGPTKQVLDLFAV